MSELKHSDDLMDGGWMDKDAFRTALDTWDRIRYTDRDINETLTSYISQNACIHRAASGQKICLRIRMIRETAPGAVPEHRPERCVTIEFCDGFYYSSMCRKSCRAENISLKIINGDGWPYLKTEPLEGSYSDPNCILAHDPLTFGLWVGLISRDREEMDRELEE